LNRRLDVAGQFSQDEYSLTQLTLVSLTAPPCIAANTTKDGVLGNLVSVSLVWHVRRASGLHIQTFTLRLCVFVRVAQTYTVDHAAVVAPDARWLPIVELNYEGSSIQQCE
jgi:hypothetical protein